MTNVFFKKHLNPAKGRLKFFKHYRAVCTFGDNGEAFRLQVRNVAVAGRKLAEKLVDDRRRFVNHAVELLHNGLAENFAAPANGGDQVIFRIVLAF